MTKPKIEQEVQDALKAPKLEKRINIKTYTPHENQVKMIADPSRFKVIRCGRRFGKTTYAVNKIFIASLLVENGTFWYVAPTYKQAKQIAWRMFVNLYRNNDKKIFAKLPNETQLTIFLSNGTFIEIKGADNEDSLRGVGLNGTVLDEYPLMKPNVWQEIMRPMLADYAGWADFIGTPKGYNHFYDLEMRALKNKLWSTFHFSTYDNPYITKEEIEQAKQEMTDDYFSQEFLAEYRKFTGLVYKEFSIGVHVTEPFQIPGDWPRWRAIDAGFSNPFCCLWITQNPITHEFYIYDEHYVAQQTTKYHSEIINGKSFGQNFRSTYIDPSARQTMQDLGAYGIYCTQAVNTVGLTSREGRMAGISKVSELLRIEPKSNNPKIFVFNHCVNTIKEFQTYRWEVKKLGKSQSEIPHKEDDHAMDSLRYFVNTYNVIQTAVNKKAKPYVPGNEITGY